MRFLTGVFLVGVLGFAASSASPAEEWRGDVEVPDVRRLEPEAAVRVLLEAGLKPGRLYDRAVPAGWPLGRVVQQAPPPHTPERASRLARGAAVQLRVAAARDGDPAGREVPTAWLAPTGSLPVAVAGRVPPLEGLYLVEAQQLAQAAGLALHVERVAGHPVGRILEQEPAPGAPRPPGGLVRVRATAGGEVPGAVAPAPSVVVEELAVPDLLDRTWPQVERILAELGFEAVREAASHGPPDRVADQDPPAGTPLARGGRVVVMIAPPRERSPAAPEAGRRAEPEPAAEAALRPIAPREGADLGLAPSLVLGFAWHPLPGVQAYVLTVEEELPEDGWTAIARQTVRRPGALLDLERLGQPPGALRWRVQAVRAGRPAEASAWVELR